MTATTWWRETAADLPPIDEHAIGAGPGGLRVLCVVDDEEYVELRRALRVEARGPGTLALPRQRTGDALSVAQADPDARSRRRRHGLVRLADAALDDLVAAVDSCAPQVVVLGDSQLRRPDAPQQVALLQSRGVRVRAARTFSEHISQRVSLDRLPADWFLFDVRQHHHLAYRAVSWLLDMVAAVIALGVLLLVGPLIALAVKLTSPGPVLYRQRRVGKHGEIFSIVKFRTMRADAELGGAQFASIADGRITPVGAFLRKSRLDELPQAWNVLRRDMSLIGPRPERPEFTAPYAELIPYYGHRQVVRPGLTGWAQVSEGYTNDLAGTVRKLERDLYYLKYQGLRLDAKILLRTVVTVIGMTGR
jgi:lipopolysaccharide/colanic/teichoic acid biosynthesis glycosyltransferase